MYIPSFSESSATEQPDCGALFRVRKDTLRRKNALLRLRAPFAQQPAAYFDAAHSAENYPCVPIQREKDPDDVLR